MKSYGIWINKSKKHTSLQWHLGFLVMFGKCFGQTGGKDCCQGFLVGCAPLENVWTVVNACKTPRDCCLAPKIGDSSLTFHVNICYHLISILNNSGHALRLDSSPVAFGTYSNAYLWSEAPYKDIVYRNTPRTPKSGTPLSHLPIYFP